MNKHRLRAFSFGIIVTVSIIGIFIYFFNEPSKGETSHDQTEVQSPENVSLAEAKEIVKNNDFIIITKTEFANFNEAIKQLEKTEQKLQRAEQKLKMADNSEDEAEAKVINYTLQVKSGMTSSVIATTLQENQIITNAEDFIDYLAINGYSKAIQLGSYELTNEMSHEEIAQLITK